jgi:hypothetical protein
MDLTTMTSKGMLKNFPAPIRSLLMSMDPMPMNQDAMASSPTNAGVVRD